MYKALHKNNPINLLLSVNLEKKELLTSEQYRSEYKCQVCNESVKIAWGDVRAPHFKHNPSSKCINSVSESLEHLKGKKILYEYFLNVINHKTQEIDLERYIPETGQIADVFIKFNNGVQWAIEYQRSNISPSEIKDRRELYKKAGIRDIWIVGENVIKDDGMLLCGILNVGKALITDFLGVPSLVCLNSDTECITIYRGLSCLNTKSYTVESVYSHKLNDICFNLWGEIFCIDDYTSIDFNASYNEYQSVLLHGLTHNIESLLPSETPGFNFKFPIESEGNDLQFHHINITEDIKRFIPAEMANLKLFTDLVKDPITYNQDFQYFNVKGVYPARWESLFKKETHHVSLVEAIVTKSWLVEGLVNIYRNKFQTMKELSEELKYIEVEFGIPYSTKMYWLMKSGLLEKEVPKKELKNPITLDEALLVLLKIINKNINPDEVIDYSINKGILFKREKPEFFNINLLSNIIVRLKKRIPESKEYHKGYKEGIGLWNTEN
ncbi:competence protein CoiA [Neobacillus niacini]|uniref:competence protein CoiA n=1 Tax=Neobacillus niacini TaxID=86668 RepID=UPI003B027E96